MPLDSHIAVKEAVLPFNRFTGVDTVLGPEMKSTGEVMGIDAGFGVAYAKSQSAAYGPLPTKGRVFVSLANRDKRAMIFPVKRLVDLGFEVIATEGTAQVLRRNGVSATVVPKHSEGLPGDAVARILDGEVDLVINTPFGNGPRVDGYEIRSACVTSNTPCVTTVPGAAAAVQGIESLLRGDSERPAAAGMACRPRRPASRREQRPWQLTRPTAPASRHRPLPTGRSGAAAAGPGAARGARRRLHPDRRARPADRRHRPARAVRGVRGRRPGLRPAAAPGVLHRPHRPGRHHRGGRGAGRPGHPVADPARRR